MSPLARWRLAAGATALLLAACAGPDPFVLNPKYRDANFDGRTVHLFRLHDLRIENEDDFRDDLLKGKDAGIASTGPEAVLGRLFFAQLDDLSHHARPVHDSSFDFGDQGLRDTLLDMPGGKGPVQATYRFPPAKALADSGVAPDLGLQIFRLRIRRVTGTPTGPIAMPGPVVHTPAGPMQAGPMMVGGGSTASSLQMDGSYILWDYRGDAPVAYGRFSTSSSFQMYMDETDWEKVVHYAVFDIIRRSPLAVGKLMEPRD